MRRQHAGVFACERRAQRRNDVGEPVLDAGQQVELALDQHDEPRLSDALARLAQAIESPTLVEYRCLRGVQILGLAVAQHTAAEGDGATAVIADREYHPIAEQVVDATAVGALADQPSQLQLGDRKAAFLECVLERAPPAGGEPEPESRDHRIVEASSAQISARRSAALALKLRLIELRRSSQGLENSLPIDPRSLLVRTAAGLGNHYATQLGQATHCFGEVDPFVLLHELEQIAALAAAEAMPQTFVVDGERRRLLLVERTKTDPAGAALPELHDLADESHRIGGAFYLVDEGTRPGHPSVL